METKKALIIAGEIRSLPILYENNIQFANKFNMDIFMIINVNNNEEELIIQDIINKMKPKKFLIKNNNTLDKTFIDETDKIQEEFQKLGDTINLASNKGDREAGYDTHSYNEIKDNKKYLEEPYSIEKVTTDYKYHWMYLGLNQFYCSNLGYNLIKDYEDEMNFKYTHIMKIRTDTLFCDVKYKEKIYELSDKSQIMDDPFLYPIKESTLINFISEYKQNFAYVDFDKINENTVLTGGFGWYDNVCHVSDHMVACARERADYIFNFFFKMKDLYVNFYKKYNVLTLGFYETMNCIYLIEGNFNLEHINYGIVRYNGPWLKNNKGQLLTNHAGIYGPTRIIT